MMNRLISIIFYLLIGSLSLSAQCSTNPRRKKLQICSYVFILHIILCGNYAFSKEQLPVEQLENMFSVFQFNMMEVYTIDDGTDLYPFKGKAIDNKLANAAFKNLAGKNNEYFDKSDQLFGCYRFLITPKIGSFLVRKHNEYDTRSTISCWLYDFKNKKIIQAFEIADSYGYEGSEGEFFCWIADITGDGIKDFLIRHSQTIVLSDSVKTSEYFSILTLKGKTLCQKTIGSQKDLELNYKFYQPWRSSDSIQLPKTILNDIILNASQLKPLNKKDPNYFCEMTFESIISKEGFRKNGMLNGEIRFYSTGKLINVITYVDDVPNGFYSAYYIPSGDIYITGNFKGGKKDGVFKEYDLTGKLISTKKYRNDEQVE